MVWETNKTLAADVLPTGHAPDSASRFVWRGKTRSLERTYMRRAALIVLAATTTSGFAAALPKDIEAFIQKRRECDHWRGEDPSQSAERRAQIEEATKKLCVGTDRELARLKHKYRSSKSVREALGEFEVKIEP